MLKYYCFLIGENYNYVKNFQPASKRKIALLANCLLVPVIMWFINGYLLVSWVLEGSLTAALLTAFITALIIFLIERAVIMSNGSKVIAVFRVALGFIVAILGSTCLDEVVFKNDIDHQVAIFKKVAIDSAENKITQDFQNRITQQQLIVDKKSSDWELSRKNAENEADGTAGSRQRNYGKIAQLKDRNAKELEQIYQSENAKLSSLTLDMAGAKENAKLGAKNMFKENAFLLRIKGMFELVKNNFIMLSAYIVFTLFLFSLEFLVVLIKWFSKPSVDEIIEKARDKVLVMKTKTVLDKSIYYFSPEHHLPSVKNVTEAMKKDVSAIFN